MSNNSEYGRLVKALKRGLPPNCKTYGNIAKQSGTSLVMTPVMVGGGYSVFAMGFFKDGKRTTNVTNNFYKGMNFAERMMGVLGVECSDPHPTDMETYTSMGREDRDGKYASFEGSTSVLYMLNAHRFFIVSNKALGVLGFRLFDDELVTTELAKIFGVEHVEVYHTYCSQLKVVSKSPEYTNIRRIVLQSMGMPSRITNKTEQDMAYHQTTLHECMS